MKKNMSSLLAMLLAMLAASSIAGCGGGGDNGGGGGGNPNEPICTFGTDKMMTIYTDKSVIVKLSQTATSGTITGTAYEDGFDQTANGTIQASAYTLLFNSVENGESYTVSLSGTVANSGGVCVSASGTYSKTDGFTTTTGTFNQLSRNDGTGSPVYDQGLNGAKKMTIQGAGSQTVLIKQGAGSDMVFGALESGIPFTGKVNGTSASITWIDSYSGVKGIYIYSATTTSTGASGTIDVLRFSDTSINLATGLTASISLLPPITLNGAKIVKSISEAYGPLPPASNVQVHDMTFTQVGTAITGTDAGGTTSSGNFVAGWGPITSGSINQMTGEITFSFEALVCGGGNSTITLSGVTDGMNGSGTITFTAGPGACSLPSGTWTMEDSLAPINIAGNWSFNFGGGLSGTATLTQVSGSPDVISSTTGTATLVGLGSFPMSIAGTLDNGASSPKPVSFTSTSDMSAIGCGTVTATATGTATATSMSGTYSSVSSTHIAACESSNVAWTGTKQ